MTVMLKNHNRETFERVCELFKTYDRVAVEQATGTGKSYITAKTISHISKKRTLYITSGREIIKGFKSSEDLNKMVDIDKIDFITYQNSLTLNTETIKDKYDFIVLDEYHRAGAKKWFIAVTNILNSLQKVKVLGTTATPIRYLDGRRNMTEELFNNIIANKIDLSRAIEENILIKPKYIISVYEYNINKILERSSKKKEVLDKIRYLTNNLDTIQSIPNILKKYITHERKFIVFCESMNHLNRMMPLVYKWFKEVFAEDVNIYSIHSNKNNNTSEYTEFKNSTDGFNLLFVINMLNEGIHIDVDGLIFLRGTKSTIIYYQQLGRALTSTNKKPPLIFDFVKNTYNILANEYDESIKSSTSNKKSGKKKIYDYSINGQFEIFDEMIDFKKAMLEIELHVSGWMEKYTALKEFKELNGHIDIPYTDLALYRFITLQKKKYYKGELDETKIKLLNNLNIEWNYIENANEVKWKKRINEIHRYKEMNGHLDIPRSETSLYKFLSSQRSLYSKSKLSQSRIDDLIKAGISLDSLKLKREMNKNKDEKLSNNINSSKWSVRFEELVKFKNKYNHCNVPRNYTNSSLAEWVHTQRSNRHSMSLERKELLLSIGFEFHLAKKSNFKQWDTMFEKLVDFKKQFNHCNVSSRYHDKKLANWVKTQRVAFKTGKINEDRYNRLIEIGFKF